VCVKEGTQRRQACTVLSGERFIASWTDYSVDPRDVAAQRFDANGQALWAPEGIYITRKTGGGNYPAVLPSGEAMVDVWHGIREGETEGAYFAQRIDSEGNFLWDTLGVLIEYAGAFFDVCSDNFSGAIVFFGTPVDYELSVQRVDSLGQIVWNPGGVKVLPQDLFSFHYLQPPIHEGLISDNMGGCFIWFVVRVQHVDSSGGLLWGIDGVNCWIRNASASVPETLTEICSDGDNGLFVVFDNLGWDSPDWPPDVDQGVIVQRVNSEGATVFDSNGVMIRQWNPDSLPWGNFKTKASAVPGGVITVWWDNRNAPNNSLYAQIVDTTGKVGSGIEEESTPVINYPILETNQNIVLSNLSLRFSLPQGESGVLKLFDTSGRLIRTQTLQQKEGVINWNTKDFPRGVYFVQLETKKNKSISKKMLILH